jgi:hypothetical protein
MTRERPHSPSRPPRRRGTPFTVYFSDQQTESLNRISRERRVPKAELLRIGVDLLLAHMSSGQLDLPLGIELPPSIRQKQEQEQ